MKKEILSESGRPYTSMEKCRQQWENLGLDDDFLFGKVMQDPKLCRELLQRILPDMKITRITFPEAQKTIRPDVDAKSVRLDIYVEDDRRVIYDVEIQKVDTKELPKRSRYYQSVIDMQLLERGHGYEELRKSFVIFICMKDIFGQGRHIYTFRNICQEDTALPLGDESVKIFLNANGRLEDVSPELKAFLDYLKGRTRESQEAETAKDPYIQELEEAVRKAKRNREWRREYMMLWMRDQENIERGVEQGMKEGIKEGIKKGVKQGEQQARCSIITRMLIQGFSDEQIKSVCDTSDEEIEECRKRADAVG